MPWQAPNYELSEWAYVINTHSGAFMSANNQEWKSKYWTAGIARAHTNHSDAQSIKKAASWSPSWHGPNILSAKNCSWQEIGKNKGMKVVDRRGR